MPTIKLGRRALTSLPVVIKPTVFYDSELTGFGLKALPSGVRSWIVEYRPGPGGRRIAKRRMVIGSAANMTAEQARKIAGDTLAGVRLGADPASARSTARKAETVNDVVTAYLDENIRPKRKASTAVVYDGYLRNHIAPAIGTRGAVTLTHSDVARFHRRVGKTQPVTANRLVTLLSATFAYGSKVGLIPSEHRNPAKGIEKYREQGRERYLSEAELGRLGQAIREAETLGIAWAPANTSKPKAKHAPKRAENRRTAIGPHVAAALRLLLLTGARLREILHLKWQHVDFERGLLQLPDSKTGKKTIVLGAPALAVLSAVPRVGEYVIAGNDLHKPRSDLQRPWAMVSRRAGLEEVRLHDLRHSFASVGAGSGMGLPIIGKLLGHANVATTHRYAHLAADPLRRASDQIGNTIAAAMGEKIA